MKYYTNKDYENRVDLHGTATIKINEDIAGRYAGDVIPKGSEIVVSGHQYKMLMSVIDDGNCVWDVIVDSDSVDQYMLSYTVDKTNFSIESINC
tara:strand:- start:40 stop:321 length:282 start_codon:yes stop_codon:yes gene_type:complete